jgi:penicillin-binding protein activator
VARLDDKEPIMPLQNRRSALALLLALPLVACAAPRAIRGEDEAGFDDQAMSTGLDQRDLQKLLHENMKALQESPVITRWKGEKSPTVAVLPLRNETTEHVDSQLQALVSDIETVLVNAGGLRIISLERQPELREQVRQQFSDGFDPSKISRWGRQVGVRYVVTGKVFTADERLEDERRVQYFMFLQVLDVETSDILFQYKSKVTKGVI